MILFYFNSLCCINYYAMNQLSWYILVTHLKTYNSILSGKRYQEWKAKIKRVEIVSFILLIIFYTLYILTIATYDILIREYKDIEQILQSMLLSEIWLFYIILIVGEIVIYWQLTRTMKQNLNFHYNKNWKNFVVLLVITLVLF